jgi:ferrochelatase
LEEIGMRGKESFQQAGGESYTMIPCLNEHPSWIGVLERMVREFSSPGGLRDQ